MSHPRAPVHIPSEPAEALAGSAPEVDMDDRALLQQYVAEGSEDAFRQLVQRHVDMVYSAACRFLGDPHLAEDATQGVFVLLAQKADILPPGAHVAGWLYNATRLLCKNLRKSEARRKRRELAAAADPESPANRTADGVPPELPSPAEELAPILDDALSVLSDDQRSVIVLQYLENKPLREVAAILGISEENARQRSSRAIRRMRKHSQSQGRSLDGPSMCSALLALSIIHSPPMLAGKTAAVAIASGPAAVLPAAVAAAAQAAASALTAAGKSAPLKSALIALAFIAAAIVASAAFLSGLVVGHSHPVAPPVVAGPITPAEAYRQAILDKHQGNWQAFENFLYANTPEEIAKRDSNLQRAKASFELRQTLVEHFNFSPAIALPTDYPIDKSPDIAAMIVTGNTTRVIVQLGNEAPSPLVLINGAWRFEIARESEFMQLSLAEMIRQDKQVTAAFQTTTAEVRAGAITSSDQAIARVNELRANKPQ